MRSKPARSPQARASSQKGRSAGVHAPRGLAGRARADKVLPWTELGLALSLTAVAVALHVRFLLHAGALWRDEVQIVNIGNMPALSEMWREIEIDTFPVVWPMLVRGWTAMGWGGTDLGLRLLGLVVGLGIVGLVWWTARQFGRGLPLISLTLFALSPTVVRYGDSLRGYGLGTLAMLLMLGSVWQMVADPTRRRIVFGLAAAVLAVHCMYFNAVILLALGCAGAAVSLRRRVWRPALAVIGVGAVAAASLLPYVDPLARQSRWSSIIKHPVGVSFLFDRFQAAVNAYGDFMIWVWLGLLAMAVGGCGRRLASGPRESSRQADLALFAGAAAIFVALFYTAFIVAAKLPTEVWYYVALMGVLAVALDAALNVLIGANHRGRVVRLACAVILAAAVLPGAWRQAQVRMTNVDLIAAKLEAAAVKGDLILVVPWWPGVTFTRYYHGRAAWTTLPELGELRVQRYDVFKQRMEEDEPIKPVLDRIAGTLRSGHSLWIVGGLPFLQPGEQPGSMAPLSRGGPMAEGRYLTVWSRQTAYFLQTHALRLTQVAVPAPNPVSPVEGLALLQVQGWR